MQSENRLFDDMVKVMNGAAGTLAGMGREAEATLRTRARDFVGGLDLVGRDEFEVVRLMAVAAREDAAAAREELALLRARLDALDGKTADADMPNANTPNATTPNADASADGLL